MKPALAIIAAFCLGWALSVVVATLLIRRDERRTDRNAVRLADETEAWLKAQARRG